jgi:hypothetical protein
MPRNRVNKVASRNIKEKAPAWLGRLSTEFANALQQVLLPELQEHTPLLSRHSTQLDQQSSTLQGIISVLQDHSRVLCERSAILREHSTILRDRSASLQEHSAILREQSAILHEHSERSPGSKLGPKALNGLLTRGFDCYPTAWTRISGCCPIASATCPIVLATSPCRSAIASNCETG